MKLSKNGMKRFGICAVCAVLTAAVCLSLAGSGALAVTSLPHIEEIIASKQTFTVLEIVPADGAGTIGYYVDGSEPSISNMLKAKGSTADRVSAANTYLQNLTARGILSPTADAAPLTGVASGYVERKPWESRLENVRWTELKLSASEKETVTGTATEQAGGGYDIVPVLSVENGSYDQIIDYFISGAQGEGYYYYGVSFTPVNYSAETQLTDGTAIYANTANDGLDNTTMQPSDESTTGYPTGTYYCVGIYPDVSLDITVTYYTGAATTSPSAAYDATTYPYAAVGNGFRQVEAGISGNFNMDSYKYVGAGRGSYSFVAGEGASATIEYAVVWYSLGYTNNNWFKRYVFDRSTDAQISGLAVAVTAKTPGSVTVNDVNTADLIVLSGGLDVSTGWSQVSLYAATVNDISADVSAAIKTYKNNGGAVVADSALTDSTNTNTNIGALTKDILGTSTDADKNYVDKSLLCFKAAGNISALVTPNFHSAYTGDMLKGFEAVTAEITYENFLRDTDSTATVTEKLPVEVTLANSLRYIINYAGQRQSAGEKTSITVLELQPGSNKTAISADIVRGWLGNPAALKTVNIVTMSTAEFVGKIDDLAETYDLIYIGASTTGMNVSGGKTVYNDGSMNGLLYSNIGDTYKCSNTVVGLLDRDYSSSNSWSSGGKSYRYVADNDTTRTFRFSGNDMTQSKADQLIDFAKAGYPVVIDKGLIYDGSSTSGGNLINNPVWSLSGLTQAASSSGTYTFNVNRNNSQAYAYMRITGLSVGKTYTFSGTFSAKNASDSASFMVGLMSSDEWADYEYFSKSTMGTKTLTFTADSTSATLYIYAYNDTSGNSTTRSITASDLSLTETDTVKTFTFTPNVSANPSSGIASGGSSTLSVSIQTEGDAPAGLTYSYKWYKNSSTTVQGTAASLTVTPANGDSYYCVVTASAGGKTASATSASVVFTKSGDSINVQLDGSSKAVDAEGRYWWDYYTVSSEIGSSLSGNKVTAEPDNYYCSYSYQWYKDGKQISNATAKQYTITQPGKYYCAVKITWYTPGRRDYSVTPTQTGYTQTYIASNISGSISASLSGSPDKGTITYTVSSGETPSTGVFAIDTERVDYASKLYTALTGAAFSTGGTRRVNVVSSAEVTSGSSGYSAANCDTLRQYLNISQPQIEWYSVSGSDTGSYPVKYAMNDSYKVTGTMAAGSDGKYVLTYKFHIVNNTDPTPASTTYDCRLYIDRNSSGLYESSERLPDIVVHAMNADGSEGALVLPVGETYQLSGGQYYTVEREMPADYVGILSWKLEVVKNGAAGIHASVTQYTHITPTTKQTIHVLQIMNDDGYGLNLKTNATYQNYIGKVNDFNIVIDQIYANQVTTSSNWKYEDKAVSAASLSEYFNKFDMLIIGFKDMYQSINDEAASAILEYSKSKAVLFTHDTTSINNLPLRSYYINSSTVIKPDSYWGYSFNTILRSRVGLDRYGVTDETLGRTKMYLASNAAGAGNQSGIIARGALSAGDIATVSGAGYTIAYQPMARNTAKVLAGTNNIISTVAEVQGLTKFAMMRFSEGKSTNTYLVDASTAGYTIGNSNTTTTTVSQVNKGQITTYPFNLNTKNFDSSKTASTISVATTHEQYYQLNMNSDDIVVWYCLSGDRFDATTPNDVTNSYYIYTQGNITYSGAGHSGGTTSETTDQEAQLFINTMVAAFRSASSEPTLAIKSGADGQTPASSVFVTSDYESGSGGLTATGDVSDGVVYFKVSDPSLSKDRTMYLYLQYAGLNDSGNIVNSSAVMQAAVGVDTEIKVYNAATNQPATTLSGGLVYYVKLSEINGLLDYFSTYSAVTLGLQLTTNGTAPVDIMSGYNSATVTESGVAFATVRKIGLFPLS